MAALIKLRVPDSVKNTLRKLHPLLKNKIRGGLDAITQNPTLGKTLKKELSGLSSYRVGHFRIIYRIESTKIIEIIAVGPRKNIYLETYRLLKKA